MKLLIERAVQIIAWSLPGRGVWIEITVLIKLLMITGSLPGRGVWIEIIAVLLIFDSLLVAPREGSVD